MKIAHNRKHETQIGSKYHKLIVLTDPFKKEGCKHWYVRCRCECGGETIVNDRRLVKGITRSCGCLKKEAAARNSKIYQRKGADAQKTHGQSRTLLYGLWGKMKGRCFNPNDKRYHRYAGRGIKICEEWMDFSKFKQWADSNGYVPHLTIDRIDIDEDYKPSNCRWVTVSENSRHAIVSRLRQIDSLKEENSTLKIKVQELERKLVQNDR